MIVDTWVKSSLSFANSNCVEVSAVTEGFPCSFVGEELMYAVRDSKGRTSARLYFTVDEWEAFLAGVKAGEFDLAEVSG
jgi:hypothetical protein